MPKNSKIDPELKAFLQRTKESPFDDLPRLVLADWLEERGDRRGELIRVQCELARIPFGTKLRKKYETRQTELIKTHFDEWTNGIGDEFPIQFRKGLLHLQMESQHLFRNKLPKELIQLIEQGWVETIKIRAYAFDRDQINTIKHIEEITRLDLSEIHLNDESLFELITHPKLSSIVTLDLGYHRTSAKCCEEIVFQQRFPKLQHVYRDCDAKIACLDRIVKRYPGIRKSPLPNRSIEKIVPDPTTGYVLVQDTPQGPIYRGLGLSECMLGDVGVSLLVEFDELRDIEMLDLGHNQLTDRGAIALANSGMYPHLEYLQLEYNGISDEGLTALANAAHLSNLRLLDLGPNDIGDAGMISLAQSPYLKQLELISVWNNRVGDEGITAFVTSPIVSCLRELFVGANQITTKGAKAIIESPYLNHLEVIHCDNIGPNGKSRISKTMEEKINRRFNRIVHHHA